MQAAEPAYGQSNFRRMYCYRCEDRSVKRNGAPNPYAETIDRMAEGFHKQDMYMVCKMIHDYHAKYLFPYSNKYWSLQSIRLHYTEHVINPMLIMADGIRTMFRLAQQYKRKAMVLEGWPNDKDHAAFLRNQKMLLQSLALYRKWSDEDTGRMMSGGGGGGGGTSHAPTPK